MPLYEVQLEDHQPERVEASSHSSAWDAYKKRMGVVRTLKAILIRTPGDGPATSYRAGDLESQLEQELAKAAKAEKNAKASKVQAERKAAAAAESGEEPEPQGGVLLTKDEVGELLAQIKGAGVVDLRVQAGQIAQRLNLPKPDLRQKKAGLLVDVYGLLIRALGGVPGESLEANSEILTDLLG